MLTEPVIVVSGLPRSGTSLMMQMLVAGGVEPLADSLRAPDPDNPRGYFELDRARRIGEDASWMHEARGKAVKIVSPLLSHLPDGERYKVILMERPLTQILASQQAMLRRRGEPGPGDDRTLAESFARHLVRVKAWLDTHPSCETLEVDYPSLVTDPSPVAERVAHFLDSPLDTVRMAQAVDPTLFRQRL